MSTIPEEDDQELNPADQDTLVFNSESDQTDNEHFDTTVNTTSSDSAITMCKVVTAAFISDLMHMPTGRLFASHSKSSRVFGRISTQIHRKPS